MEGRGAGRGGVSAVRQSLALITSGTEGRGVMCHVQAWESHRGFDGFQSQTYMFPATETTFLPCPSLNPLLPLPNMEWGLFPNVLPLRAAVQGTLEEQPCPGLLVSLLKVDRGSRSCKHILGVKRQ